MPGTSDFSTEWSSTNASNASEASGCRKCKKSKSKCSSEKSSRRSKSSKKSKRRSSSAKKDDYNGYEVLYEEEITFAPKQQQKLKKSDLSSNLSEVESSFRSSNVSTTSLQPAKLVKPSETSIDSIDNMPSDDSCVGSRVPKYPDSEFSRPELAPTDFFVGGLSCSQIGSLRENSYRESGQKDGKSETSSKRVNSESYFLGAMKERHLRKILKPNEFRLYYKIPRSRNDITVTLPLQLAYASVNGKVYHYPVLCKNPGTSKQGWTIGKESASFSSLSSLIAYYQVYSYLNPETGTVEIFPTTTRSRSRRSHN